MSELAFAPTRASQSSLMRSTAAHACSVAYPNYNESVDSPQALMTRREVFERLLIASAAAGAHGCASRRTQVAAAKEACLIASFRLFMFRRIA